MSDQKQPAAPLAVSPTTFTTAEESFLSQGVRCAARVYRPAAVEARPVVVMGHGFAGVRALRLYAYAERFAEAGYVVVVFDYRGFGDSDGSPRQILDIAMQLQDWRAALQFARELPGVDPQQVVAWGTSLGGGHVITLAGQGEPIAAIIAQVPHVSGPARSAGHRTEVITAPRAVRPARPGSRPARPRPRLRRGRRTPRHHRRHDQP